MCKLIVFEANQLFGSQMAFWNSKKPFLKKGLLNPVDPAGGYGYLAYT